MEERSQPGRAFARAAEPSPRRQRRAVPIAGTRAERPARVLIGGPGPPRGSRHLAAGVPEPGRLPDQARPPQRLLPGGVGDRSPDCDRRRGASPWPRYPHHHRPPPIDHLRPPRSRSRPSGTASTPGSPGTRLAIGSVFAHPRSRTGSRKPNGIWVFRSPPTSPAGGRARMDSGERRPLPSPLATCCRTASIRTRWPRRSESARCTCG